MSGPMEMRYKIGMLAPSGVGKTTLIASMLTEGQRMLTTTSVALRTADAETANKVTVSEGIIRGALRKREFEPRRVPSTTDPFYFKLLLEPRGGDVPVLFEILDYPGGWLEDSGVNRPEDWGECRSFLADATVLLIPIDSVLLMEAGNAYAEVLPEQLAIPQLEQLVLDWAKGRREKRRGEPALAVFCPVKCESYLADNGGIRDESELLRRRTLEEYGGVIETIRREAGHAVLRYLPIDTFGCVELTSARWQVDRAAAGGYKCYPHYRVRPPGQLNREGLKELMMLLSQQLIETARLTTELRAEYQRIQAEGAKSYAEQREGIFRDWWLRISGQRQARRAEATVRAVEYGQTIERATSLADVLAALADPDRIDGQRLQYIS
jgi:hypothetical protein